MRRASVVFWILPGHHGCRLDRDDRALRPPLTPRAARRGSPGHYLSGFFDE
jgi:hypothetical protein